MKDKFTNLLQAGGFYEKHSKKNSRTILSNVLVQSVTGSAERQMETFHLGRQQEVILRIKGICYGSAGGQGVYQVRISTLS